MWYIHWICTHTRMYACNVCVSASECLHYPHVQTQAISESGVLLAWRRAAGGIHDVRTLKFDVRTWNRVCVWAKGGYSPSCGSTLDCWKLHHSCSHIWGKQDLKRHAWVVDKKNVSRVQCFGWSTLALLYLVDLCRSSQYLLYWNRLECLGERRCPHFWELLIYVRALDVSRYVESLKVPH